MGIVGVVEIAVAIVGLAEDAADVARQVGAIMTQWLTAHGVPLVVDYKVGRAWGDLKKFDPANPKIEEAGQY